MACTFKCDGCGAEGKAEYSDLGDALKPRHWYHRSDKDGPQHACSRRCIDSISDKSGKTNVILPI